MSSVITPCLARAVTAWAAPPPLPMRPTWRTCHHHREHAYCPARRRWSSSSPPQNTPRRPRTTPSSAATTPSSSSSSPSPSSPDTAPVALVPPASVRARLPNLLTFARVAAVPLLGAVSLIPALQDVPVLSAAVFAAAALTDLLDGALARRWRVESALGKFLDPVADKLLVAVALVVLSARFPSVAVVVPACVIVARELFVSALREWMALRGADAVVQVSVWGKVKTAVQMTALTVLLALTYLSTWYARAALLGLAVSAALAVFSAVDYTVAAIRAIAEQKQ